MTIPEFNIQEYTEYNIGNRVIHRGNLTRGTLLEMTVIEEVVHMWVQWDDTGFPINMHYNEVTKLLGDG